MDSLFTFPVFKDSRGALCPMEFKDLPFKPKRAYFIFDTKTMRGGHVHKKEQEIFVCVKGSITARIHNGKKWKDVRMYKPGQAIYTPAYVWHEFEDFTPGSILMALSSTSYEGNKNYITDFKEFLSICHKKS